MILRGVFHLVALFFLVLVVFCIVGWIRSANHYEGIFNQTNSREQYIGWYDGHFEWTDVQMGNSNATMDDSGGWYFQSIPSGVSYYHSGFYTVLAKRKFSFWGFEYRVMPPGDPAGQQWIHVHHIYMAKAPIWLVLVLSLLPVVVWCFWFKRRCRIQGRIKRGCCIACGYDLRESTGKTCPECGAKRIQSV